MHPSLFKVFRHFMICEAKDISVNSGDDIVFPTLVKNKAGECRWGKDLIPVGMFKDKYVWAGPLSLAIAASA
jgi:hypothetical protein